MLKPDPIVTKAITAAEAEFQQLFNAANFDRLVKTFYTEDAKFLPPNMPIVAGRAGITGLLPQLAEVFSDIRLTTGPVFVSGELTVTNGTYQAKLKLPDGRTVDDRGKYVGAFRKEPDGSWKCFIDTFTSDIDHTA